ncbi:ECF transporter S component [Leuconostocaceae bacterium ESL0958]|nr:ECF transporter S component [Leuconostocaceae bacterium ESL0958]
MSIRSVKTMTILAVLIALNLALSYVVKIPVPATGGFVNLVEAGIFLAAWTYGREAGLIVGGMSGALLDLLAGYPQWLLFSLVIHGLEGYLAGLFGARASQKQLMALTVIASLVMITGYVFASAWLYHSMAAGYASIIGNTCQCFFGAVIALAVWPLLKRHVIKV